MSKDNVVTYRDFNERLWDESTWIGEENVRPGEFERYAYAVGCIYGRLYRADYHRDKYDKETCCYLYDINDRYTNFEPAIKALIRLAYDAGKNSDCLLPTITQSEDHLTIRLERISN